MKTDTVQRLAREAADLCGVELYHVEWSSGQRGILRVTIDRPEGVTVGDCERVSRELGTLLDVEDPVPGRYTLEVSSPGLDRRLYTPAHFRAHVGREIDVRLRVAVDGSRRFTGALEEPGDEGFSLLAADGARRRFVWGDVETARLIVKF